MNLSIIIPTHNRPDLLRACLAGVARNAPGGAEILVVDDASPGGVAGTVAAGFPGVRVIRLDVRSGFCVAANTGIRAASGEVVELLNDDTEVQPGWAESALGWFDDPTVGAVAPLVLNWDQNDVIDSAGDGYHLGGFARKCGNGRRLTDDNPRGRFVFGASGSSAFYRREALLRVGLFPEAFGAYFEDVDVSFRLHRAGYRVRYEPAARVLHHVSASYGKRPDARLLEQQSRNEELVFWRNVPRGLLARALPLHAAVLAGKAWRRMREGSLLPFLRGRISAWLQLPAVVRHRRALDRLGREYDVDSWCLDGR